MIPMKEELIAYITARIDEHKAEQQRLRRAERADEAAHQQIIINMYGIFQSIYRAMNGDLPVTIARFRGIMSTWEENRRVALAHEDSAKAYVEEIKLNAAADMLRYAEELEGHA